MWLLSIAVLSALIAPSHQVAPIFVVDLGDEIQSVGISEDTEVGTTIGFISCFDPDGDIVQYITTSRYLEGNMTSGEVKLKVKLDKETKDSGDSEIQSSYRVTFQCFDFPSISFSTPVSWEIKVIDVNDNVPQFVSYRADRFDFTVSESEEPGYFMPGNVFVEDADSDDVNARLVICEFNCQLNNSFGCDKFQLHYNKLEKGQFNITIELISKVDYETRRSYQIAAIAVDSDIPNLPTEKTGVIGFRILIQDSQDTDPEFIRILSRYEVLESLPVGTTVAFRFYAQDGDSGSRRPLDFEILENQDTPMGYNLFRIGAVRHVGSGVYEAEVIVNGPIDYEDFNQYEITVKVTELEDGVLTDVSVQRRFTINFVDANDNPPLFNNNTFYIDLDEAVDQDQIFMPMDMFVYDLDSLNNAFFRVEIVGQTFPGTFRVKPEVEASGEQDFYLVGNTVANLDYEVEANRQQVIDLRAMETRTSEQFSSFATIYINLIDRNDHSPIFTKDHNEKTIYESHPRFSMILTLSATDEDSGNNGRIEYIDENNLYSNTFEVDSQTGEVNLTGPLVQEEYSFRVVARDFGDPRLQSEATVVIHVILDNRDGPVFIQRRYTTRVNSGSTIMQPQLRLQAVDPDDGAITYEIVSGNTPANAFVLDPDTGLLSLQLPVTFAETEDELGIFTLVVKATDDGTPRLSSEATVTVTVLATNDFPPVFSPRRYFVNIPETIGPEVSLLPVFATDEDYGTNGRISYVTGVGALGNFAMKENSLYTSLNPIFDFEEMRSGLEVKILAIDGGFPQFTATATLFVTVEDANNKAPKFVPQSYTEVISEGAAKGTEVIQLTAIDSDQNDLLHYTILRSTIRAYSRGGSQVSYQGYDITEVFAVGLTDGLIIVSRDGPGLDRDFVASMEFQVQVEDINAAPNSVDQINLAYITIIIEGLPEVALFFDLPWTEDRPEYRLKFAENDAVGTLLQRLQANDPVDSGMLPIRYEEVPGTDIGNYCRLENTRDVVLNRMLDYENGPRDFVCEVMAIKGPVAGYPSRTVSATIYIEVLNVNDNSPQFYQPSYNFTIEETDGVGSFVGSLRAYDNDGFIFGAVEIRMGVGQNKDDFRLETVSTQLNAQVISTKARLLVNAPLDYERIKSYDMTVFAIDSSSSGTRKTTEARVMIKVQDKNDNRPRFLDVSRSFSIPETAVPESPLGRMLAIDLDSGNNGIIEYSLHSASDLALRLFRIDMDTGKVETQLSLRGLSGTYDLRVMARDRGSPPLDSSIPITIKVQGVEDDDGTPVWVRPEFFVVYVTENNVTELDIQIRAVARTPGANITYSLGQFDNDHRNFTIDMITGEISVLYPLDREEQDAYTLLVEATDTINQDKMSRRPLTVIVVDVDDNEPSFEKSRYAACPNDFEVPTQFDVPDDTPAFTVVGRAVACDPDDLGNNEVVYKRYRGNDLCNKNYNSALEVLPSGEIRCTMVLDYEVKKDYLICVTVMAAQQLKRRKREYPRDDMTDTDKVAYVIIHLIDNNDNGPVFTDKDVTTVLETVPPEEMVIQVVANDADGPGNNRVIYAIRGILFHRANGRDPIRMNGAFTVNPDNGVVRATLPSYQGYSQGYFVVEIVAFDFKNRAFSDSVFVTMVVYQKSQILKVVLDKTPEEGQEAAKDLIEDLNEEGKDEGTIFYLIKASEHRRGSTIVATQTDVCFVVVEDNHPASASTGLRLVDSDKYGTVLKNYEMVDRGTCYALLSTKEKVKWRDLWWVLVAVAIFLFICTLILLITICILYDRYKSYMETQRTYLVPQ